MFPSVGFLAFNPTSSKLARMVERHGASTPFGFKKACEYPG